MRAVRPIGRIYDDNHRDQPRTHVFIIGVGRYAHGRGQDTTDTASGLDQLSSPPRSAFAIADYFLTEFANPDHPLGSVTMLVSGDENLSYKAQTKRMRLPRATLRNVTRAMSEWREAIQGHPDNMIVFYFCGHGVSMGQKAVMLLEDFGNPENEFAPAIDLDLLRGSLKRAMPGKQLLLIDCCRTQADHIFDGETSIGSRVLSVPTRRLGPDLVKQSVLFPTLAGLQAFGVTNGISVFTECFLEAVRFAAINDETGTWGSSVSRIQDAVSRLVTHKLRARMRRTTIPTAMEVTSFEFNHVAEPQVARSIVAIDDEIVSAVAVTASKIADGGHLTTTMMKRSDEPYRCCTFELAFGRWRFSGAPEHAPPHMQSEDRDLLRQRPFTYVELRSVR